MRPDHFAAVLWDMDGTLVDTEPLWMEVQFEMVEARGGTWSTEQAHATTGTNNVWSAEQLIAACPPQGLTVETWIPDMVQQVVAKLAQRDLPWQPGARELVAELAAAGVPQAIVTASPPELVAPLVAQLPVGTFSAVVTGTDVTHGKPHPEPYLTAADRLGVDPTHCLALEDSAPGAKSATDAGAIVLTVPSPVASNAPTGHHALDGLTDLTLERVLQIWSQHA